MSVSCHDGQLDRERAYYEELYREFAVTHFAKPAVVRFRQHLVDRLLASTGVTAASNVLSIGCGVGDTELLIAPHVASITGVDLSEAAIAHARATAHRIGASNAVFEASTWQQLNRGTRRFDTVLAIFFLHHLPDAELGMMPPRIHELLKPGGVFYALEPSARRLSGAIGELLCPGLMRKFQAPDERQLNPRTVVESWREAGYTAFTRWYDFMSTPLAGLFPAWEMGYRTARLLDNVLVRIPGIRELSSNFELIAIA